MESTYSIKSPSNFQCCSSHKQKNEFYNSYTSQRLQIAWSVMGKKSARDITATLKLYYRPAVTQTQHGSYTKADMKTKGIGRTRNKSILLHPIGI
jgi:hypothetical protein